MNGNIYECSKCPNHCKQCGMKNNKLICYSCYDDYIFDNDKCINKDDKCISIFNGHCLQCKEGRLNSTMQCDLCEVNECNLCYYNETCTKCNNEFIRINETYCEKEDNYQIRTNNSIIQII